MKYTRDLKFIHFWKKEVDHQELQRWLDVYKLYNKKAWLILLEEKLDRAEKEI